VAPLPPYIPWDEFMLNDERTEYYNRKLGTLRQTVTL